MQERNYVGEYLGMWVKVIAVYILGGSILGMITENAFSNYWGVALALVVFGTTFFNKVVNFNLFGNHDVVFFFWIFKILICFVIGIFAFPIVNLYYIINIIIRVVRYFASR